jgi:hypothetical protein
VRKSFTENGANWILNQAEGFYPIQRGKKKGRTHSYENKDGVAHDGSQQPPCREEQANAADDQRFTPRDVTAAQIPVAPQAYRIVLSL